MTFLRILAPAKTKIKWQRPPPRQRQRQTTIGFMGKSNSSARASRFLEHLLDVHCTTLYVFTGVVVAVP